MAESENKTRRTSETVILILVLLCMVLIISELTISISSEIRTRKNQAVLRIDDEYPTPVPTLTKEEYQKLFNIENAGGQAEP